MPVSVKQAIQYLAPLLGGQTGSITSGTATTAVLTGLVGSQVDDFYNGHRLIMVDAVNTGDRDRIITDWTGSSGTATFATRTDTTYTSEDYVILPKDAPTLTDINSAIERVLQKTRRPVRLAVPTIPDTRAYSLAPWTWIERASHVRAVTLRRSPNLLANSDFAVFNADPVSAPVLWTLAGASGTIARQTTYVPPGKYNLSITRVGTNVTLTFSIGIFAQQLQGETIAFGVQARSATATHARMSANDGISAATATGYHDADSQVDFIETTHVVNANAIQLDIALQVNTTDAAAQFLNPVCIRGTSVPTELRDFGDDYYRETLLHYGSDYHVLGNVIYMTAPPPRDSQLVVYSDMPFRVPSPTVILGYSTETDCPYDLLRWGAFADLAAMARPEIDKTRWDRSYLRAAAAYTQLAARTLQLDLSHVLPSGTFTVTGG